MKIIKAFRIVTFVPAEKAEDYADKVTGAVPGFLGNYDKVAWWCEAGTEQYRPLPGAEPAHGNAGELCRVPSVRMEFSIPAYEGFLEHFIPDVVIAHHPWEEPVVLVFAHDIVDHEKP